MIAVSGKIIDQITGEALTYANVYFSDRGGQILPGHHGSSTDENGHYSIEGEGAYVTASFVGYPKETKPFKNVLDFELNPSIEFKEVEVIASRSKSIGQYSLIAMICVVAILFAEIMYFRNK